MENNIDSPTNETLESANPDNSGAGNSGNSLTGNTKEDLAQGMFGESIPKPELDSKQIPLLFLNEQAGDSEVNAEPEADSEDELDLSLLDGDSEEHTNEESEDESESEQTFEIQVNGESFKVSQSELIADAQKYRASESKFREASTLHQEATSKRKEADELVSVYSQERETLSKLLNHYQNIINQSYKAMEPNWEELFQNNPAEYVRQKEFWGIRMQELQAAQQQQEAIKAQQAVEQTAKEKAYMESERTKVFEQFPTWKDESVRAKALGEIAGYLGAEGFSEEEINSVNSARLLQVAHKAAMYDKLVKAAAEKKAKTVPSKQTLKAGSATNVDPGFKKRQEQTSNAREEKAWKQSLKNDPSGKNFEAYLKSQWEKKIK